MGSWLHDRTEASPSRRIPSLLGLLSALALSAASLALLMSGPREALAQSPDDPASLVPLTVEQENPPEGAGRAGGAAIVTRPTGVNVVTITPDSDGITITDANGEDTQSDAPLWPDNPRKDDPGADPGAEQVDDAVADGENLVVLNRPATATHDGDAHAEQWAAWYTTYWQLVANGVPFVECATVPVEECWVTDPALVPDTGPETTSEPVTTPVSETTDNQPSTTLEPAAPEDRWPGRNYEWQDPGPAETTGFEEGETSSLVSTGQNPDDGSEIVIVHVPPPTDDAEQRRKNYDLENETLDALDAIDEPYVICFPETTTIDINTGQPHTTPAFCSVVNPSGGPGP